MCKKFIDLFLKIVVKTSIIVLHVLMIIDPR